MMWSCFFLFFFSEGVVLQDTPASIITCLYYVYGLMWKLSWSRISASPEDSLQRLLQRDQDHGWGYQLEVLIYTYWLAHGLSYRVVASVFCVPKATVHRVVHRVAQTICSKLKTAISFPQAEQLNEVGEGFVRLSGKPAFQVVVGAIDGCHIRIKPPKRHHMDYLNYKGFYSINMQAICDSTGRFLDVFVAYPGSVHDTRIMKNSTFYQARRYPPPGYVLLGDGGYPCLETPVCLITPYKEPVNGRLQGRFNYFHSNRVKQNRKGFWNHENKMEVYSVQSCWG